MRPVEFDGFLQAVERADPPVRLVLAALLPEHARRAVADALGDREDDHD
ncbi:MAG: hypothetical protein Q8N26_10430 [Myxococcales bacterium]|nr:hypothetical protein [Myxococcales bacterium]